MKQTLFSLFLLCLVSGPALAQKLSVSGTIVDSTGEPMPGATVVIMNPDSTQVTGQQTKADGTFMSELTKPESMSMQPTCGGGKIVFTTIDGLLYQMQINIYE